MSLEDLRMLDFVSAVFGCLLVIVGAETWMKKRWIPVRISYSMIGLPFLALSAHYINTWTQGAVLNPKEVYALHVWTNCAAILTICCAGLERLKNKIAKKKKTARYEAVVVNTLAKK